MATAEGARRKHLSEYSLSISVHDAISSAWGIPSPSGAPLDTGRLLVALVQKGSTSTDAHYAPTVLRRLLGEAGGSRFDDATMHVLSSSGSLEEPAAGSDNVSASVLDVLDAASQLPKHDGILAARHLIVALLEHVVERGMITNAGRLLQSAQLDARELLLAFTSTLPQFAPEPEQVEWGKILRRLRGLARSGNPLRPAFDTDTPHEPSGHDCLDLTATVSAMANLIASPHLDGNLSLGVFGNWGSGKSFFMRRLRDAITQLSAHAKREAENGSKEPPDYWQNVVQIEFNAWHYVDANLWASLVSHLLEELSRLSPRSAGSEPGAVKPALELALGQLRLATDARNEAARVQKKAESARNEAQDQLVIAGNKAANAAQALAIAAAVPIWSKVREKVDQTLDKGAITQSLSALGLNLEEDAKDKPQPDSLRVVRSDR